MTQVGKILVLAIVGFSLVFLGISITVFTTSKNWKEETRKEVDELKKFQKNLADAKAQVDATKKELADSQSQVATTTKQLNGEISKLEDRTRLNQTEIRDARGKLVTFQEDAKSALAESAFRRQESQLLRTQISADEKQANEFKQRQTELIDRIRELESVMDLATHNNSSLREKIALFTALLQKNGASTDISQIQGTETPPKVEGLIKRVDATNRRVEITIGSDDGLVVGHELNLYRTKPRAEFLGKIQIIAIDPNQAVGVVVGKTYQGKKLKAGDIVSSTISPRF